MTDEARGAAPRAIAMMAAFAVLWAVLEGVLLVRLQRPYELTQIVWGRYAVHLALVFAIWGRREPARLWTTGRPGLQIGRSLLMLVMPVSFGLAARAGMSVDTVWGVMWLAPAMMLALAHVLLGERPTLLSVFAAVAGSLAALLVLEPAPVAPPRAMAWALVTAASLALYVVLTRVLRREPLRTNLFYTAVGDFVPLTLLLPWLWTTPTLHDVAIVAALGGLGFVALVALNRAMEHATVTTSATFLHLQVVATVAIALAQRPHLPSTEVLGGALVILLLALLRWREGTRPATARRAARRPATSASGMG